MADANTIFLATFDGVDGAKHAHNVFDRDVPCPVFLGTAALSNTTVKYGTTALYCDGSGSNKHVYIPAPSAAILNFGTNPFSIDCWLYPINTGVDYASCWGSNDGTWGTNSSNLSFRNPGHPGKYVYSIGGKGGTYKVVGSTTDVTHGAWCHTAITRSGNTFRFFLNGVKEDEQTYSGNVSFVNGLTLGQNGWSVGQYVAHRMQYFRISDIARWTADFTPPTVADYDIPSSGALPDIRTVPLMPRRVP